ncbi:TetR/AcrR family transcriptional regulator [Nocardia terpenica]|uniref:TetR family transcriptional regulator n=1 Tax=Nocardia terpenica TaxID=455432 RepID=A0A164P582_9NOCA|nr:TetR/AcrR family transcriptional regulator [Nocardia terpenica]KZM75136.1 TetR family transcriptional regulator [Nocardia terpenica]NQE93715.1 TetR/AcrR family transcriptional regulator [Nocardia terpenica]
MVTSAEQGRETRARLMDAAVELIAERGWGAVTTRMVAERAELRPGLVHYHFNSVNDLLIDASLRMVRALASDVLGEGLDRSGPAGLDRLLAAIAAYTVAEADTRVFSEMLLAATRYERLQEGLGVVLREFRAAVAAWLRSSGSVPDPEATAVVLVAALDGLILHRLIDPRLGELGVDGPLRRLTGMSGIGGDRR